jgi:SAM-dependent methyltransferase
VTDDVAAFSEVGDRYGEQLARGLRLTGESAEFFARHRIARVAALATRLGVRPGVVLDFGCGTGTSLALLRAAFPAARVIGYEPAAGLRALAVRAAAATGAEVIEGDAVGLAAEADVAYCNGVFHHIAPDERRSAMTALARALRPRGLACIWENSPWNPGTRLVMSRIPFDRDARLLTPGELRALLRGAALTPRTTEYHFVFPRALRALRPLETALRRVPVGGQYVVCAQRD